MCRGKDQKIYHLPPFPTPILILVMTIVLLFAACDSNPKINVIADEGLMSPVVWQDPEREIIVKKIFQTDEASHHQVWLRTAEKPHIHDFHDLTAIMMQGTGRIHFSNRSYLMNPGDLVYIPRGTFHWAENLDPEASEIYVIFTPPFDGKDRRMVDVPG
jgi:quercetin dioxygenase-like cupin family protein